MKKIYRPNVAMIVTNDAGEILACQRSDVSDAWQLPQGGIDAGETPEQAMYRELREEIGTDKVQLIGKLSQTIRYDWPEHLYSRGFHGQEQTYFLLRIEENAEINLKLGSCITEFSDFCWLNVRDFLKRVSGFKLDAYRQALDLLQEEFPGKIKSA